MPLSLSIIGAASSPIPSRQSRISADLGHPRQPLRRDRIDGVRRGLGRDAVGGDLKIMSDDTPCGLDVALAVTGGK